MFVKSRFHCIILYGIIAEIQGAAVAKWVCKCKLGKIFQKQLKSVISCITMTGSLSS